MLARVLLVSLLALASAAFGQDLKGPRLRAAVTAMEVKVQGVATTAPTPSGTTTVVTLDIQQPTEFGTGLAEMLVTALVGSERFVVLERLHQDDLAKEREIAKAQPDADPTAVAGPIDAQVVIRGAITEFSFRRSGTGVESSVSSLGTFANAKGESTVGIDLKVVDIATGQVLHSVHATGRAKSSSTAFSIKVGEFKLGNASFDNSPLGKAIRSAIEDGVKQICAKTSSIPWQGKVLQVEGEDVYVNAGSSSNLRVGDVFEVRKKGIVLRDPDTKTILGSTVGALVGQLQVVSVEAGFCIARAVSGEGFAGGQVVKFVRRG